MCVSASVSADAARKGRKQFCQGELQSGRELRNIDDGDVALASLNAADVIAMQACALGQLLLGEPTGEPQLADPTTELP
jgi:hypothetical protein